MIGLLLALVGLGKTFIAFRQQAGQNRAQAVSEYWAYQQEFIRSTNNLETNIVRQLIVLMFVAALFSPTWGAILTENAKAMPIQGWLIIIWEFYGAAALNILPWFRGKTNGNGNGKSTDPATPPDVPTGVSDDNK